jgi:TRAP-type C4-dicarboxylate transport system permease small subunit
LESVGGAGVSVFLAAISRAASYCSAFFLAAMMLITVADVVSRAVGNMPITGTYDLVQLFLVGAIFLSIPEVFLRDENIVIDFIDHVAKRRVIYILKLVANLGAVIFLLVLSWRMVGPALDSVRFHEVSPDVSVPMIVHWTLMLAGIVLALLAAVRVLIESVRQLLPKQAGR